MELQKLEQACVRKQQQTEEVVETQQDLNIRAKQRKALITILHRSLLRETSNRQATKRATLFLIEQI